MRAGRRRWQRRLLLLQQHHLLVLHSGPRVLRSIQPVVQLLDLLPQRTDLRLRCLRRLGVLVRQLHRLRALVPLDCQLVPAQSHELHSSSQDRAATHWR